MTPSETPPATRNRREHRPPAEKGAGRGSLRWQSSSPTAGGWYWWSTWTPNAPAAAAGSPGGAGGRGGADPANRTTPVVAMTAKKGSIDVYLNALRPLHRAMSSSSGRESTAS
jgi:hypothetical protein